jgi:quercetin dioxygenase-like cupin family protein
MENNFQDFALVDLIKPGFIDFSNDKFPSSLSTWNSSEISLIPGNTHFGFVYEGTASLAMADGRQYTLVQGMYFSVNSSAKIIPGKFSAKGFVVSRLGYQGFFNIGGPVEPKGRYKYIDGCSDSLLVSPVVKGDPCLNLLYFPPDIFQTPHTHPSLRIGVISRGSGQCILSNRVLPLQAGNIFFIRADTLHSFKTTESDMTIVVYHPESDFGPTDQNHPMINKTIINGVSASLLYNLYQ